MKYLRPLQPLAEIAAAPASPPKHPMRLATTMRILPAMRLPLALVVMALIGVTLSAQASREYAWYRPFRDWLIASIPPDQHSLDNVVSLLEERLKAEGIDSDEIRRRVTLLRDRGQELENEFWNQFFTIDKPAFNTQPNGFLVSVLQGRKPGTALDVGMGEGRNSLYLAKLGWEVTGFDPAGAAVALAQQRADSMKLKLRTHVALDSEFDFGREQWDLIVYSWVPPTEPLTKVADSLRPGGLVVVEVGRDWYGQNELLRKFDALRIVHYEVKTAQSDFFMNGTIPVVQLAAEKPAQK